MSPGGRPATTGADDWAQAALDEIEDAGVRALTVEAVARRLGVSKGGAYHHVRDRRDLLRAAFAHWERRQVTALNAHLAAISDPRLRLRSFLEEALITLAPTVIMQLMAATLDPDVAEVLERSTAARIDMSRRTFIAPWAWRAPTPNSARSSSTATTSASPSSATTRQTSSAHRRPTGAHINRVEASLLAGLP